MDLLDYETAYAFETRLLICVIFCFGIVLPLSMIKNMHGFRYISLIVIGSLIYTMSVMLI
jgi:hypothetical protein